MQTFAFTEPNVTALQKRVEVLDLITSEDVTCLQTMLEKIKNTPAHIGQAFFEYGINAKVCNELVADV